MRIRIVYVHHSGFVLHLPGRSLVFDIPAAEHLPAGAAEVLVRNVAEREVLAVISHSHADHFNPRLPDLLAGAASVRWAVSYDVAELHPEFPPPGALVLEPDEPAAAFGARFLPLESNDMGVAVLLELAGLRMYFGGDLACWDWEGAREAERAAARAWFAAALERVAAVGPLDVAFSNADGRLSSLAGGPEAARRLRPGVFVPMHTFGRTAVLDRFMAELGPDHGRIFLYERPGDSGEFEVGRS